MLLLWHLTNAIAVERSNLASIGQAVDQPARKIGDAHLALRQIDRDTLPDTVPRSTPPGPAGRMQLSDRCPEVVPTLPGLRIRRSRSVSSRRTRCALHRASENQQSPVHAVPSTSPREYLSQLPAVNRRFVRVTHQTHLGLEVGKVFQGDFGRLDIFRHRFARAGVGYYQYCPRLPVQGVSLVNYRGNVRLCFD